ncbi:twin-arginine translocase TatA/TatE family subunit [Azospirillum thermophilum]|uniref:Sec-independent protein translocase protein TatA n=1 Tax=Azospirillum thermophilum TaxID=2202148 RepID=A0A2S2CPG4_9PROT|nr:twin-arginine translocase TatA/TatE family subunit [Azospirillum thermophilum]AWK86391.1 twin-arginine translocase TatA/TatE family subunit [Azospirillum thermophilum]
MGSFSIWHWLVVLVIVLLLFGAGKLPNVMGDLAKGIKAFKAGMKDEDEGDSTAAPAPTVQNQTAQQAAVPPAAPAAAPAAPAATATPAAPQPVQPQTVQADQNRTAQG